MSSSNTDLRLRKKWLETPIVNENKIKKQKNKFAVKWDIFEEFLSIEKDDFWHSYWNSAARGKFPIGFFFNGKSMSYSHRNNTYITNLKDDVHDNYRLVKYMFQNYGHIYSPDDMEIINNKEIANEEEAKDYSDWSSYNKIQQKNLLTTYVKKISKIKKINKEEELKVAQTLNIGLVTGRLNKKDIIIKNGEIKKINNTEWDDEINGFYIMVPYVYKPKKNTKKVVEIDYGRYPRWNKWIASVENSAKKSKDKIIKIDLDKNNDDEFSSTLC